MSKRAVLYARVSTDEQAEKGYSLPSQLEACRNYAGEQGYTVAVEVQDEGASGAKLDRPGLDRVRGMIDRREVEAVIVYSADRLTRNLAHSLILRDEWKRAGVELHYCNRGQSQDTPEGRMTENIEGVFAEYWREKIREGSMRGKRAKARAGRWVGAGPAPYGYQRKGKGQTAELFIFEPRAAVVRRIYDQYTGAGGHRQLDTTGLAITLTAEGVSPPRNKRGGWYPETVRRILDSEVYIGVFVYKNIDSEPIRVELPQLAIVDRGTWQAAQARRKRNRELATRNRKREYLLSGFFRCTCGGALTGVAWRSQQSRKQKRTGSERKILLRYMCCNRGRGRRHFHDCREASVNAPEAESLVWGWLAGLLKDDDAVRRGLRRKAERDAANNRGRRERLETVHALMREKEAELKGLAADLRALQDAGEKAREALREEYRQSAKVLTELEAEGDRLAAELERLELTPEAEARILEEAAKVREGMDDADYETRRYFLDRLGFTAQLRRDEGGRWLDMTSTLTVEAESAMIDKPSHSREFSNQTRLIVFSACLPLDGQPVGDGTLAAALFAGAALPVTEPARA